MRIHHFLVCPAEKMPELRFMHLSDPVEQARALANWVVASGKNLTTIYATHGHRDHFFGTSTVLDRFPDARFVAPPDVIKIMRQQASAEFLATFWNPRFPGQISSHLAIFGTQNCQFGWSRGSQKMLKGKVFWLRGLI